MTESTLRLSAEKAGWGVPGLTGDASKWPTAAYRCQMERGDVKTGNSFDFDGFWWMPPQGGEPRKLPQGTLFYDPAEGVEVSVVDLFGGPAATLDAPSAIPVLHGMTLEGKPCTLLDLVCRQSKGHLGGHSKQILGSNLLIFGAHVSNMDDLEFSRARIGFRGLGEWLTERWPHRERSFEEISKEGVLAISLDGGRLVFQKHEETSATRFTNQRKVEYSVLFEFDQPITLSRLNEDFVRPLHDLLVLGTNEEIRVTETTLLIPEETEKWWDKQNPIRTAAEIPVVLRGELQWHADRPNAFNQVPLPLAALGTDLAITIQQWYTLRREISGPGNALFAALNRRFRTLEVELLGLLSAAEGYHRARFNALTVPEDAHVKAVASMIEALPSDLRDNYSKRLTYANEQTQAQRLRELFENAESVVPATSKWRKAVHGLVQTRNYLTHWGDESDAVLSIDQQFTGLKKLEIVLRINLMRDIGVDPIDIAGSIGVSHGHHQIFA
jgi:hypothetical protein